MWTDPIVDELHKIREEHAKKFHNDLHAIFADFKEKEVQSGRQVISLPVKRKLPQSTNSEERVDSPVA